MGSQHGKRHPVGGAALVLTGTIVGVGMFGVPYAIGQVGVWMTLAYFLVLGGIQLLQSLYYAEVVMACPERLRLVGLTERYLGRRWRKLAATATVFGFWGSLIAYVLVGGSFLHLLLSPLFGGAPFHYQIVWGAVGAVVVLFGLEFVEKIDFWTTVALAAALLAVVVVLAGEFDPARFTAVVPHGDLFLPYGVILFSLSGISAIPEMEDMMGRKKRQLRQAIVYGALIATALTVLFGLAVYGVTGAETTGDALSGLQRVLGGRIVPFCAAVGFLAVATSYFMIGLSLRSTFEFDYRLRRPWAWLLAVVVPLALVLAGINDFISTVGFTGAVFGGSAAVIVVLLYLAVDRHGLMGRRRLPVSRAWAYVSIAVLSLGAVYETVDSLRQLWTA